MKQANPEYSHGNEVNKVPMPSLEGGWTVYCWDWLFCHYMALRVFRGQSMGSTMQAVQPVLWQMHRACKWQTLCQAPPPLTLSFCNWAQRLARKKWAPVVPLAVRRYCKGLPRARSVQQFSIACVCKGRKGVSSSHAAVVILQSPCSCGCYSSLAFLCCFSMVHMAMFVPLHVTLCE